MPTKEDFKSKGVFDTLLGEVMGFQQTEMEELLGISRSAISKRMRGENEEHYNRLKNIMLEEAAREAGKLLARASFERWREILERTPPENKDDEQS